MSLTHWKEVDNAESDNRTKTIVSDIHPVDKAQIVHTRAKHHQRHISRRVRLQTHTVPLAENTVHQGNRKNLRTLSITKAPAVFLSMGQTAKIFKESLHTGPLAEDIIHRGSHNIHRTLVITRVPVVSLSMDKVAIILKVSLYTASKALFSKAVSVNTNHLSQVEMAVNMEE